RKPPSTALPGSTSANRQPDQTPEESTRRCTSSVGASSVTATSVTATSIQDSPGPLLCATPAAIQTLRHEAPEQARAWRFAVRRALTEALADGYHITGFTRSGWYLLD
ncbi:putative GNAT superfamily acetyltransferase, partial [Catenulispora sp. MAP12-49]